MIKGLNFAVTFTFVRSKVQWIDAVSHKAMYSMQCFNTVQKIHTLHIFSLMGLFSSTLEPKYDAVQTLSNWIEEISICELVQQLKNDECWWCFTRGLWYLENLEMVGVQHSAHFSWNDSKHYIFGCEVVSKCHFRIV